MVWVPQVEIVADLDRLFEGPKMQTQMQQQTSKLKLLMRGPDSRNCIGIASASLNIVV
jgi:hypothetical protein